LPSHLGAGTSPHRQIFVQYDPGVWRIAVGGGGRCAARLAGAG